MSLSKKDRQVVWDKSRGMCWYCGCPLPKAWHADHVDPVLRNTNIKTGMQRPKLDNINNIVPSCPPCNLLKGVFSVADFRREIEEHVHRAQKTSVNFRTALRFGQVELTSKPVVFWFEVKNK